MAFPKALGVHTCQPVTLYQDCQSPTSVLPCLLAAPLLHSCLCLSCIPVCASQLRQRLCLASPSPSRILCLASQPFHLCISKCLEGRIGIACQVKLNALLVWLISYSSNPVCLGSSPMLSQDFGCCFNIIQLF